MNEQYYKDEAEMAKLLKNKPSSKYKTFIKLVQTTIINNYHKYDFPKESENEIAMITLRNDLLFESINKCLR